MYKAGLIFLMLSFFAASSLAQDVFFKEPLSARANDYQISLRLDTEKRQITAEQTILFRNPSADTIWTMPFHMYYNAFKNNKTTFLGGEGRIPRNKSSADIEKGIWSWIKVDQVEDANGNVLTDSLAYIQPDDGNENDHTVLELRLKEPILPHAEYRLQMRWSSQIPKLMIRTGYSRDFYFMAQWYPKLGVYEPAGTRFAIDGQWNCHQYHSNTEYYGEFGLYEVSIDLPKEFVVGASGFLVKQEEEGDRIRHHYRAEDVIDFTWAAHPDFVEVIDEWRHTKIHLLIMPEHLGDKDKFLEASKHTLDFLADYLEPYPYPTLTIVSPPFYGLLAGAMEYPTLFTAPTLYGFPKQMKSTETLVIHELIHQYFMQMVASNEMEEPWMDEGFTSFFEAKIMDTYYPDGFISWDQMGVHVGSRELRRGRFLSTENIKVNPLSDYGWHFRHGGYSSIVYSKAATLFNTLEGIVGEQLMQEILKTYFQRWKFKHPGRQDFIDVALEVVNREKGVFLANEIDQFLEQAIYGTDACDYAVASIRNEEIGEPLGFFDNTDKALTPTDTRSDSITASVILFRLGEFSLPQEVLIRFDDGSEVLETWDGKARSHEFNYLGTKRIVSAHIDPNLKVPIDLNLINNSLNLEPEPTGIRRFFLGFLSWLQGIMISLSSLV